MYKLLLCWRDLRTRWIALASIISVTLGVCTMIVVNSVMEGFRHEMQERIHGILSDVVFEANTMNGFYDPDWHMQQIQQIAGEYIEGMTATVVVPAMLSYQFNDVWVTKPVQLIGIDARTQSQVGDFCKYLQHPQNREQLSFDLRDGGYDTVDHQAGPDSPHRPDLADAGWVHRRKWVERKRFRDAMQPPAVRPEGEAMHPFEPTPPQDQPPAELSAEATAGDHLAASDGTAAVDTANPLREDAVPSTGPQSTAPAEASQIVADSAAAPAAVESSAFGEPSAAGAEATANTEASVTNPFAGHEPAGETLDPATQQNPGIVIGIALAHYVDASARPHFLARPGDDVQLSFPTAGTPPDVSHATFTIVDLYESKMSEYDSSFVFVPIDVLQRYRGMFDPETNRSYATSIQIKLKPGADGNQVRDKLRAAFMPQLYVISTWRDKQGPLLAAVQMETAILNVLLFMIIFVAGFGILAIFFMIVVEKTRDIGILKALGASRRGILGIFLGYGLSLGIVGAGTGMVIGLLFVAYINEIADLLGKITGQEVFDPAIYYFQQIPTIVVPATVASIVCGALFIAVMASVLPARRAAKLHPVEALRYE